MEIIINKKTYTLKNVNSSRRQFFVAYILPNYTYQQNNFEEFILQIQKELLEKHKISQTIDQVKRNFFKEFSKSLNKSIWSFLTSEDKKEIGIEENLNVSKDQTVKFIEWVCNKIKTYSEYVGSKGSNTKNEDGEAIYAFLAHSYGWTFEQMKEMDELELLKAVEEAISIKKREQVENINSQALAGAFAGGSKQAKGQIDKLNRNLTMKEQVKELKKTNPNLEMKNELTRDQLQAIMNADAEAKKNGR